MAEHDHEAEGASAAQPEADHPEQRAAGILGHAAQAMGTGVVQRKIANRMIQRKAVYRGMKGDSKPEVGNDARSLGVRDSDVTIKDGNVEADGKGMSCAPDDPKNLPDHRRPTEFGGTGKDPVWSTDSGTFQDLLWFNEDKPGQHGNVAAKKPTKVEEFRNAIGGTQGAWTKVKAPEAKK